MAGADHMFARLVMEAVAACGDDTAAIERYVFDHLGAIEPSKRQRYQKDLDLLLKSPGFREGDPPH